MKKRFIYAAAAGLLMFSLAGCGSESDSTEESYNFQEAEQVYGDIVHLDEESFSLPMEYDGRFITNDMASSVADYFYAVQTKDTNLYDSVTIEDYQNYLMNEVYAEENYDKKTFIEALYNGIKNQTDDNFNITCISIADFDDDADTSGTADIIQLLSDMTNDDYSELVSDSAKLTLDFTVKAGGDEYEKTNQEIYILNIDGTYRIVTG